MTTTTTLLYPAAITRDRYGGVYSGGEWLAWPLRPDQIPDDANGDDVTAADFWAGWPYEVGKGSTPAEALADLERQQPTQYADCTECGGHGFVRASFAAQECRKLFHAGTYRGQGQCTLPRGHDEGPDATPCEEPRGGGMPPPPVPIGARPPEC